MDIATLLGLIAAFGLVIGSILVGGGLGAFIDIPSLLIVVGGTGAVALINYPLKEVLASFKVAGNAFKNTVPDVREQVEFLIKCADMARKDGVLALEKELGNIEDEFMKKGLQMLVDGMDPDSLKSMLYDELYAMDDRHRTGSKFFGSLASTAPAMGLIGTLIGLVQMLQAMDDPSAIGPAMAVALLTTFYGALIANVIFTPISGKLSHRNGSEMLVRGVIIKGVLGIAEGENPRVLGQRLMGELAPAEREGGEG
ncbi:MAG: MotA/TolQ/ExbB proton channel family protein [Myxococcota bacterium]|jgi:chemotaxis protein MotA|nr:MotA/TolQ/ExbB proton channel family protein [Myxococcota bacterium]